jgi:hypothetical protein
MTSRIGLVERNSPQVILRSPLPCSHAAIPHMRSRSSRVWFDMANCCCLVPTPRCQSAADAGLPEVRPRWAAGCPLRPASQPDLLSARPEGGAQVYLPPRRAHGPPLPDSRLAMPPGWRLLRGGLLPLPRRPCPDPDHLWLMSTPPAPRSTRREEVSSACCHRLKRDRSLAAVLPVLAVYVATSSAVAETSKQPGGPVGAVSATTRPGEPEALARPAASRPSPVTAACSTSGGRSGPTPSEWTLTVTARKGVGCAVARRVMRRCGARRVVSRWTPRTTKGSSITFLRKRNRQRRFSAILAGGTPRCLRPIVASSPRASSVRQGQSNQGPRRLRRCGSVPIVTEGVAGRALITARGVRCRVARRTASRSGRSGRSPRGWTCLGSGDGVFCAPGSASRVQQLRGRPQLQRHRRYVKARY